MLRASVWRVEVMVGSIPASVTMGHHLTVAAKQKNNKVCIVRTWHRHRRLFDGGQAKK